MNGWMWAAGVLLVGGLAPALGQTLRGAAEDRLVGLLLAGPVLVLATLLLAQAYGQPSYLIVPLTLAVLSFAGVLVFARLLGPER
jgi:multisubunit Na+/H+ antiporter MnhF subunit